MSNNPVQLANNIPLQKIQWVSKRGFTSQLNLLLLHIFHAKILKLRKPFFIFYFNKIITVFAETSNNVLHAGDLLARHLLIIGASVCLYPLKFAIFGEVGETTTRKYRKEKFSLFQSVEEVELFH